MVKNGILVCLGEKWIFEVKNGVLGCFMVKNGVFEVKNGVLGCFYG
jgi:hypothetical protein